MANGNELTVQYENPLAGVPEEVRTLVRNTIFPKSDDNELALFIHECKRRGVHPLDRMIHPQIRMAQGERRITFVTSIDLLRAEAEKTSCYAPGQAPTFETDKSGKIISATAFVKKLVGGQWFEVSATAYWSEFYPGEKLGFMWTRMPHVMLSKAAEAQALRRAFPIQTGRLYSEEEMHQRHLEDDPLAGQVNERGQPRIALDEKTAPVIEGVGADLQAGAEDLLAGKPTEEEERKAINGHLMEMLRDIADDPKADLEGWPEKMERKDKMKAHCEAACGASTLRDLPIEVLREHEAAINEYYSTWKLGEPEPEPKKDEIDEFGEPAEPEPEKEADPEAPPKGAPPNMIVRFGAHKGKNLMELASESVKGGRQTLGYIVHKMGTKNDKGEQVEYFVNLKTAARWYLDNVKEKRK